MNDRIKLATAMGWNLVEHCGTKRWVRPGSLGFTGYLELPLDTFTDANDDYAVLEWARDNLKWKPFVDALALCNDPTKYQIGDYARAALEVLK